MSTRYPDITTYAESPGLRAGNPVAPTEKSRPKPSRRYGLLTGYYLLLLAITVAGLIYGYYFSDIFFPSEKTVWVESLLNAFKLAWLIPLPYALLNFYSFVRYPIFIHPPPSSIHKLPGVKLYFRYVTRGQNPALVAETTARACQILASLLMPQEWIIEVVSDRWLDVEQPSNGQVRLIIVPSDYQTPSGAKFKGRALQYAVQASLAGPQDWIIHLDEETGFDAGTVREMHAFIARETQRTASGKHGLARVGQGVILYGRNRIVNYLTTLADSIRVGDDYGRFRLQFEHGKSWFGLHGSFIVINNGVEQMVGFDHGPASSITEDCYFALVAQGRGVEYEFIHAFMYEKSPFSLADFVRQRRRWFGGLWLCVLSPDLPLKSRLPLGTFMLLWSLSWMCILMVYINFAYPTGTQVWLAMVGGVSFMYYVSLYIIGFLRTFSLRQLGLVRYLGLFALQLTLIPIFSIMEAAGVLYGVLFPPRDFFVVQKEVTA